MAGALALPSAATAQEPEYEAVEVETFAASTTYTDDAPGYPDLLFVTEQDGVVRVLENEEVAAEPFLDINGIVQSGGEEGLLSIAFPPDYEHSRRFYVYFTNNAGNIEVDEFKRKKGNPLRAQPSSRREVIVIPHPGYGNHNGGTVRVDDHGRLWLATGDGGGGGDGDDNARDLTSLLGKLIRLRPVPARPNAPGYRIPKGNPFAGGDTRRDEIFSYGLRNPYRFTIDEDLDAVAIGDVGQGAREEVDFVPISVANGGNFGWPEREGELPYDPDRPGADPPIDPMFTYANPPSSGAAITGGLVIRDPGLPSLAGQYVFADVYEELPDLMTPDVAANTFANSYSLPLPVSNAVAFTEGVDRQIYVTALGGTVYRLEQATP